MIKINLLVNTSRGIDGNMIVGGDVKYDRSIPDPLNMKLLVEEQQLAIFRLTSLLEQMKEDLTNLSRDEWLS